MNREPVSDQLERWLKTEEPKTLGSLIHAFGPGSFALLFILLLSPSALPLPTGGLTHVFEVTAMLLALQLMIGRREVWLPARWQRLELGGDSREKFIAALLKRLRWLERFARPRWRWLFGQPASARSSGAHARVHACRVPGTAVLGARHPPIARCRRCLPSASSSRMSCWPRRAS